MQELRQRFEGLFGHPPAGAVRAPGRVNLIGEHTDYNDGFVLPIAIQRDVVALYAPRQDSTVRLASVQLEPQVELDLQKPIEPEGTTTGTRAWGNYCRGVAAGLVEKGVALKGCDVLLNSDVPIGGGLSSSAALEVATGLALMAAAGRGGAVTGMDLARLCRRAENTFAGAPCGIMDQAICVLAQAGHAMLLDCRTGETQQVPLDDPSVVLLVADTKVKHSISDGGYGARRAQCESSAAKLGVRALRDVTGAAVDRAAGLLEAKELMRARHVVGEIVRTLHAAQALRVRDYRLFGRLMYASHASLRDDYEVSCEELDAIVELARPLDGVYGARMTGGGFGGCAIVLADAGRADAVSLAIAEGFAARFGHACPIFATRAAAGAGAAEL